MDQSGGNSKRPHQACRIWDPKAVRNDIDTQPVPHSGRATMSAQQPVHHLKREEDQSGNCMLQDMPQVLQLQHDDKCSQWCVFTGQKLVQAQYWQGCAQDGRG